MDNEWLVYHKRKLERADEIGSEVYISTTEKSYDTICEFLDAMRDFLPERYPSLFVRTTPGLDNIVTGEKVDFTSHPLKENPMVMAAKSVQDDLVIMIEEDGQYYSKAGVIMLTDFWRLKDKLGITMSAIHTSGDDLKYNERNNYFIQTDDDIAWSSAIGAEDSAEIGWCTADVAKTAEQLYFRSERQSLRKLPRTGAVVFIIHTYFLPIPKLCVEPFVSRSLAKYNDVFMPYLEEKAREQEEIMGHTLDKKPVSYPY
ncbi:hypothetical protein BABINDRAFT_13394 [Babjeviella inositovora NRRL Y-12698]|uniref:DUF3445 domain-containing protein n=1 Tax=Babjeviella inositovora NRRL Y-12698 TaxID=984486 RepID=A0A1E3QQ58_9ASCO|nr:uncharacterized protein BABINDRAFT_13394 [Babjeviella inositovora NRRL Y-12698]ODQ79778.1 hypothetical protein BABINDRAFT_13394 [Babjeviella inositovora NRRL Y-12698]